MQMIEILVFFQRDFRGFPRVLLLAYPMTSSVYSCSLSNGRLIVLSADRTGTAVAAIWCKSWSLYLFSPLFRLARAPTFVPERESAVLAR